VVVVVVVVVVVQLEKSVQSKWFIAERNTFLHLLHLLSNVVHKIEQGGASIYESSEVNESFAGLNKCDQDKQRSYTRTL